MERRKHHRIEAFHPVLYYSDTYPRPKIASTLNISLGGAGIETRFPMMRSEGLEISIAIRSHVIKCRGEVVYVLDSEGEKVRVGVQFEGLSKEDNSFLGEYLSSITKR